MSRFAERTFLRLVLLAASFLVIPAFAQFEIAPDHFDGSEQQTATHKSNVKAKAKPARTVSSAVVHPAAPRATATVGAKRNASRRPQQIARQSKADVAVGHEPPPAD